MLSSSQDSGHPKILFTEKQLNWQTFQFFINPQRNIVKLGTTRNTTKACLVIDAGTLSFAFTKEISEGVNLEINLNIVINMIS